MLPARLIFSVWATPGFAKLVVIPFTGRFKRLFKRRKDKGATVRPGAGTGATDAGAVPKTISNKNT